jgi:prepilin-type N-terminal cleavage/methylation domain-containing protein
LAPRRPAGFTLVELTIVIVVLGIGAGLAVPALTGLLAREGDKSTTRILTALIGRARSEAILTGQPWQVTLDWAKGEGRLTPLPLPRPPQPMAGSEERKRATEARTTARSVSADGQDDTKAIPKKAAAIPPVSLPDKTRPRLALSPGGLARQPDSLALAVAPEGLCQPAFVRLSAAGGAEAALVVEAVGCRVSMLTDDLETAQTRFQKALGLLAPAWAGQTGPAGQAATP